MLEKITSFLKDKKRPVVIILLLAVGLLLLTLSSCPEKETEEAVEKTLEEYKAELEDELESACSMVGGVGKCRVIVTFERGTENSYKGSQLLESKPPRVMGVSVICQGADSASVRSEITEMMTALFDIGSNRVAILKLGA
ncbi:MAG: hypothetical protein IJ515_04040 [Clostridia bacterium]|nr:hypothetical protein [Clostridia bacterium]